MAQTAMITDEPLWDRIIILASTSPNEVIFFGTEINKLDPNGGATPKTLADTNMEKPGSFSDPESFTVKKIRFMFEPGTSEADMLKILQSSWLEFKTSGNTIVAWRAPTMIVPAGCGVPYSNASATPPQNGYPAPSAVYTLVRPLEIFIGETFKLILKFGPGSPGSSAAGSPAALSGNIKARAVLEGDHYMVDVVGPELDDKGNPTGRQISTRRAAGGRGQ